MWYINIYIYIYTHNHTLTFFITNEPRRKKKSQSINSLLPVSCRLEEGENREIDRVSVFSIVLVFQLDGAEGGPFPRERERGIEGEREMEKRGAERETETKGKKERAKKRKL